MKKALITLVILGVIGAGGYGVYHYFFEEQTVSSERVSSDSEDAVYVDSISSITGFGLGNGLIDRYGGEVEAQATLEVKLDSDRTLAETYVKEGDRVSVGDKLFSYDTQENEDKIAQAEIDIDKAEADIELLNQQIAQYEKDRNSASSDDQLTISAEIASAETQIKTDEYTIKTKNLEIEKLQAQIEQATVTAEMGGIVQKVTDSDSDSSSYYSSGSSAYITILADGEFRIKGTLNEQNYDQLETGMTMIIHSRVDDSLTWTGTISEIKTESDSDDSSSYYYYSSSSADSSSYTFYVELDSSDGLMLGQHVYMEPDQGQNEQKDGLWLEEYYIIQENGKAYVWLANSSNVLEKHEITLGEYDEDLAKYEITEGLEAEDYIAYPMDGMTEGTPVIYNDDSAYSVSYSYEEDIDDLSDLDEYDDSDTTGLDDLSSMDEYDDSDTTDLSDLDEYDDSDTTDLSDLDVYDDSDVTDLDSVDGSSDLDSLDDSGEDYENGEDGTADEVFGLSSSDDVEISYYDADAE